MKLALRFRKWNSYTFIVILSFLGIFPVTYLDNQVSILNVSFTTIYGFLLVTSFYVVTLTAFALRTRFSKYFYVTLGFAFILLISTTMSGNGISYVLKVTILPLIEVIMLVEISVFSEKFRYEFINGGKVVLLTYTIINTVTLFLYPDSLYLSNSGYPTCWFLGEDNAAVRYYILAVFFCILEALFVERKSKKTIIFSIVHFAFFVSYQQIGAGIAALAAVLAMILINKIREIKISTYLIFVLIFFCLLVGFNKVELFSYVFNLIGRDTTLTGRAVIWQSSIDYILQRPILGWGVLNGETFSSLINYKNQIFRSTHNTYLMILFTGGIVAMSLFIMMNIMAVRTWSQSKKSFTARLLVIFLFAAMIRSLAEGSDMVYLILEICLIYHIAAFDSSCRTSNRTIR